MQFSDRCFLHPYFIAEVGVNHEGNFQRAVALCDQAKEGGADAVKFQTYKADKLAASHSPSYWDTTKEPAKSQRELFQRYDAFGEEDYRKLAKHCETIGIDFVSTPFDLECLDWLIPLMNVIKIASADITNFPLLQACASFNKPVVISVGAATDAEIEEAIQCLNTNGASEVIILHCVLNYPTPLERGHLFNIQRLKAKYDGTVVDVGYSDHVAPSECDNDQLIAALMLGVTVIEKHFTDDKTAPGNDHYHAVDMADLSHYSQRLRNLQSLWGGPINRMLDEQKDAIKFARRSLYYADDLSQGTLITADSMIAKRPGLGLPTKELPYLIGKTLKKSVCSDQIVEKEHFSE